MSDDRKPTHTDELVAGLGQALSYIRGANQERNELRNLLKMVIEHFPKERHLELSRIHSWINRLEQEPDERFF